MKSLLIAVLALTLSACAGIQKLTRGILSDEYSSEAEVRQACQVETDYRGLNPDDFCDDAVKLYRELQKARILLDEDSLRDWLEDRLRQEIGI